MQHEAINGVVIRVRDMGATDRYLTVLTPQKGRMTFLSKGSRSMRGGQASVSQLYTYANFEYYRRGDLSILKGGSPIEPFYALSADIDRMDLAAYFCDVIHEVTDEGESAEEVTRLLLNSLFAVSRNRYSLDLIKGAFELRIASVSGYRPDLSRCSVCEKTDSEHFYLDVMNGSLLCADCLCHRPAMHGAEGVYDDIREADVIRSVSRSVVAAMRYCISAPSERLFSFELADPADLADFSKAAETYLLSHLERGFDSLRFYHEMRKKDPIQSLGKENPVRERPS